MPARRFLKILSRKPLLRNNIVVINMASFGMVAFGVDCCGLEVVFVSTKVIERTDHISSMSLPKH